MDQATRIEPLAPLSDAAIRRWTGQRLADDLAGAVLSAVGRYAPMGKDHPFQKRALEFTSV